MTTLAHIEQMVAELGAELHPESPHSTRGQLACVLIAAAGVVWRVVELSSLWSST